MTDQELDRIMRRVLIDSMKAEQDSGEPHPPFQATRRHQRQMRAMLADPLRWLHRRERPLWKQIARRAAVFFLAVLLLFGGVMALSPSARAAVLRWVEQWDGNRVLFVYSGEQRTEEMPQYEIAELPEGYVETVRNTAPGLVAVVYKNAQEEAICFRYVSIQQGALTGFDLDDGDTSFDVQVNSYKGTYFESSMPGNFNTLTWIDTDQNLQFIIDAAVPYDELLRLADSISLCKTPEMPEFGITALPEGYIEIERTTAPGWVDVTYENGQKGVICFSYVLMHQGALSGFQTENADVFEIEVNSHEGLYFESRKAEGLNTLTWIDTDQNIQFTIDGLGQYDELLRMADSVSLCKTLN